MKKYTSLILIFAMLLSITCSVFLPTLHVEGQDNPQIVILKLDDLQNSETSVAAFEKVVQLLETNNIKAGFGIISDVLASPASPNFISRIQAMANNPRVEIWNHGYSLSKAQNLNSSNADLYAEYSNQQLNSYLTTLKTSQNLVYNTLGVTIHSLGAPGNMTDANFANAIKQFPEIKTLFFPSPTSASSFTNMEILYTYNWENPYRAANTRFDIESGTGNPSYDTFMTNYNKGPNNPVMVLQGHPWGWDNSEFAQVQSIIDFLKTKNVVFMTPFEYYMYKNPTANVQSTPSNPVIETSTPTPTPTATPTATPTPTPSPTSQEWPALFEDDFQDENGIRPLTSNATDMGPDKWSTINYNASYDAVGMQEPGNTSNIVAKLYAASTSSIQYPQMRKCVNLSQGKFRIEFRVKADPAYQITPGVVLRSQSGTQIPLITASNDGKFRFGYGAGLVSYTNEWQTVRLEYDAATKMLDFYLTNSANNNSHYGPYAVPIVDGFSLTDPLIVLQATIPAGTALGSAYAYYDDVVISKQATAAVPTVLMSPISILAGDSDILPQEEFSTSPVITRSGSATAKFRINNNMGTEITPQLIAAVYSDRDTKLRSCSVVNVPQIGISGVKDAEIAFNVPDGIEDGTVKFMLWDGGVSSVMRPYLTPLQKQVVTNRSLSLANVFQDGCVIQRDKPVRVFGEAPSGAEVTVSFGGSTAKTTAVEGRFLAEFANTFSANATPRTLTVSSGASTVTVSNVLVGDVLVGGGQSNMAMTFDSNLQTISHPASIPANMRYFKLNSSAGVSDVGQRYITSNNNYRNKEYWQTVTTSNVGGVSAVMYFAAEKMLAQNPDVPVGLIIDAWGGTLIQQWLSPDTLFSGTDSAYTGWRTDYQSRTNLVASIPYSPVSGLYHYQTATIMPYTAKAFVWYQGESNPQISLNYHIILKEMIEDYRRKWKDVNMPLFVIQLPGWHDSQWPSFRLKQAKVADITNNAYVIVTNDTGDDRTLEQVVAAGYNSADYSSVTVHPADKKPIGDRLGRSILANIDGEAIAFKGPTLSSVAGTGTTSVTLSYTGVNDGLVSIATDGSLPGFETSADGTTWTQAQAAISGNQVVLSSASTINYVRYGYVQGVLRSLASKAENDALHLPAAPFRTDNNF